MYTCGQCELFPDCKKKFDINAPIDGLDSDCRKFVSEVEKKCDEFTLSEEYSRRVYKRQYVNYDGTLTDFALHSLSAMDTIQVLNTAVISSNYDRITDKLLDTFSEEQLTALILKIFEAQRRRKKN